MFHALPPPDPQSTLRADVLEKHIDHGRLADSWFTGDKDDLPLALEGFVKAPL